jgi:hypothetical protein
MSGSSQGEKGIDVWELRTNQFIFIIRHEEHVRQTVQYTNLTTEISQLDRVYSLIEEPGIHSIVYNLWCASLRSTHVTRFFDAGLLVHTEDTRGNDEILKVSALAMMFGLVKRTSCIDFFPWLDPLFWIDAWRRHHQRRLAPHAQSFVLCRHFCGLKLECSRWWKICKGRALAIRNRQVPYKMNSAWAGQKICVRAWIRADCPFLKVPVTRYLPLSSSRTTFITLTVLGTTEDLCNYPRDWLYESVTWLLYN